MGPRPSGSISRIMSTAVPDYPLDCSVDGLWAVETEAWKACASASDEFLVLTLLVLCKLPKSAPPVFLTLAGRLSPRHTHQPSQIGVLLTCKFKHRLLPTDIANVMNFSVNLS